jgi:hypothetical protein
MNDLYMTVKPGMTLHITVAGDIAESGGPVSGPAPEPLQGGGPDAALAAALDRLERSGSPHVREVAEGLMALGYTLVPASSRTEGKRPENYVRFHDPARPGPAIGYLLPQSVAFTRDREQIAELPGGRVVPSTGEVQFSHTNGAARGLEVAKMLKG